MMTPAKHELSLPSLLRAARRTYGDAVRKDLIEAGYDDIPGNGIFVIGAIARAGVPLGEVVRRLGVSKQAGGQLVDTLVLRGYLVREADPDDRRRLTIRLSERGRAAARVARSGRERVDAWLEQQVTRESVESTRATLLALIQYRSAAAN